MAPVWPVEETYSPPKNPLILSCVPRVKKYAFIQELPQDNFLDIDAWKILDEYTPNDIQTIQSNVVKHLEYTLAKNKFTFDKKDCYFATGCSIRDRLIESFNDT